MKKILTIIIPVYEYVKKLEFLIESIDPGFCNVILIDDGSTINRESVINLCKKYSKQSHIKVVLEDHAGTWETRKKALQYVETPYFTFADSDDLAFSKHLEHLCHKMQENELKFGVGRVRLSYDDFWCGVSRRRHEGIMDFEKNPRNLGDLLNTVWGKVYHQSLIPEFFFEQNVVIYEDTIAPYLLAMHAKKGYFTNKQIYFYQMRHDSTLFQMTDSTATVGLRNLYLCSMYRRKAFDKEGKLEDYISELDAIDIRLFLQRIQRVYRDKRIQNSTEISEIILKMMTNCVPNWEKNSYYKEHFRTAELNDTLNACLAKFFLTANGIHLHSSFYESDQTIDDLCDEYTRKLIVKR